MPDKNAILLERKQKIDVKMDKVKHKIAVMSGKGGVGKTTTAINLAYGLSIKGYKVGVLDADLHGPNVPIMFGVEGKKLSKISVPFKISDNLCISSLSFFIPDNDPVIWKGPQKMTAIMELLEGVEWQELDFLIIDLPPGTGDETLAIAQNIKGASALIVSTPQNVSILDLKRALKFAKLINLNVLGIIENMSGFVCPNCNKEVNVFKKGGIEAVAKETKTDFLGSVPLDANIVESSDNGLPFISNDSLASRKMNDIIEKIIKKVNNN
ncbi:Mrp/NBP35 family ATP-binding protein [Leptotrichia sp. oral taxon 847]|uniref:Mrp/NBP35 family ATP-binding protein n=1 Tax=Leptotrichia sp. oral taxon 847 TaxID=1785996 RepID=UPI0007682B64|nr:Mrp/NBP35 family ATP-binding protein [Leptotrichia sp. oral taxon 847]AMD94155.1 cobyrinic acid a,c-diamide synthase [Leptotrichia sp. oral taxon 847]